MEKNNKNMNENKNSIDDKRFKPVISVIIPIYNAEEYLRDCLESVLAQTFREWELWLINDGSSDKSGIICDEYAQHYDQIRVIHQHNQGHTKARSRGCKESRGDFVYFMDSDDWIEPQMFALMYEKVIQYKADIVQCSYRSVADNSVRQEKNSLQNGLYDKARLEEEVYPVMLYSGLYYTYGIAPNLWNKLFKRELIEGVMETVDSAIQSGEDGLITYQAFLRANSVYLLSDCLYNYRSRSDSVKRMSDERRLEQNHLLFTAYELLFKQNKTMKHQLYYYVIYQTLLAVESDLSNGIGLIGEIIALKHKYKQRLSRGIEKESIAAVLVSQVKGKKNKLILGILKCPLV